MKEGTDLVDSKLENLTELLVNSAVVVIDMQNDFVNEKGKLYSQLLRSAVEPIQRLLEVARAVKLPIIYVRHVYPPNYVGLALFSRSKKFGALKRGTWGTEIIDELKPVDGDPIVEKQRYGAFYNTNLEIVLRGLAVKTLIVTGVMTNACVESTVREAHSRDYPVLILSDCTATGSKEVHETTLKRMPSFGIVASSEEVISLLRNQTP